MEKQREVVFRNSCSSCRPRVQATGSSWPPMRQKGTLATLTTSAHAPFHYWVGGEGVLVSMATGREARAQQPRGGGSHLPQSCQVQPKEIRRIRRRAQSHCQPTTATVAIPAWRLREKIMQTIMWLAHSHQRKVNLTKVGTLK